VPTAVAYGDTVRSQTSVTDPTNALGNTTSTYASVAVNGLIDIYIDDAPFDALSAITVDAVRFAVEGTGSLVDVYAWLYHDSTDLHTSAATSLSTTKQWYTFTPDTTPTLTQLQSGLMSVRVSFGAGFSAFEVYRVKIELDYTESTITEDAEPFTAGTVQFVAPGVSQVMYPEPWTHAVEYAVALVENEGFFTVAPWTEAVTFTAPSMLPGSVTATGGEWTHTVEFTAPSIIQIEPPVPPPIPWQTLLTTDAWAAAISDRQRLVACRVDLIDDSDSVVASFGQDSTLGGVVSGSVECNKTRAVRWTCDLVLSEPQLVPQSVDDWLGPLSRLRARVWWLIRLSDNTWGEVPVGTFHLNSPRVSDKPDGFSIQVTGDDPVAQIRQARWIDGLDLSEMRVDLALKKILEDRAPWVKTSITPVEYELPSNYFVGGDAGGDPWDAITAVADAGNLEVAADRLGVITAVPADRERADVRDVGWAEGDNCSMFSLSHQITTDDMLNVFLVEGASPDLQGNEETPVGVSAVVRDDDPTSPLWVGHGRIYSDYYQSDAFTTEEQCIAYAKTEMARRRALINKVELVARARPDLDLGDVVVVSRARSAVWGTWEVLAWSMALGPNSGMSVVVSDRRRQWEVD